MVVRQNRERAIARQPAPLPTRRGGFFASRRGSHGFVHLLAAFCLATGQAAELARAPGDWRTPAGDDALNQRFAAHRGRPLLINFWASWCDPCREEMPALQRLSDRQRPRDLVVITVAVADSLPAAETFLADHSMRLPLIDDRSQAISRAWKVRVLPSSFVFDRQHRLRWLAQGPLDWDAPAVARQLQPLLEYAR